MAVSWLQGDNAVFEFVLEDRTGTFVVNGMTGEVSVQDSQQLDREQRHQINCTVRALQFTSSIK